LALVTIFLIISAPVAVFAGEGSYSRSGVYVGISGVYQNNIFENRLEDLLQDALSPVPVSLSIEDSGGLGAVLGYRLASFFAAELQYEWVDAYSVSAVVTDFVSGKIFSLSGHTLTANTKFILPIWRIQPYVLLGIGFSSWEADRGPLAPEIEALDPEIDFDFDSGKQFGLAGRAGVGVDLYITRNLLLNAQGQVLLTTLKKPGLADIDGYNYLGFTAGLQYRF
jgi:opacity protein-like surface antigen